MREIVRDFDKNLSLKCNKSQLVCFTEETRGEFITIDHWKQI